LLLALVQEGYATRFNLNLFVKSQVTISGILAELDPTFKQDDYVEKKISGLVWKELPKRLLYTLWFPAWNSRSYRSLVSNEDIKDFIFGKPKDQKSASQNEGGASSAQKTQFSTNRWEILPLSRPAGYVVSNVAPNDASHQNVR